MSKIVCTIGVMGGGKDFAAKQFCKDAAAFNQNMVHMNFADELREMAWDILDWRPANEEEYEAFKLGKINVPGYGFIDGRKFLQRLGTEAVRKRNKNFWASCWADKALDIIPENKRIACSDARFVNEIETILRLVHYNSLATSTFVFCNYKSDRYDASNPHPSEKLAQRILADGYKHGEILPKEYLEKLIKDPELRKAAELE